MLVSIKLKYNAIFPCMLISVRRNISREQQCALFAVGVGFSLRNDIYAFPGGADIILMERTGVAIDDNHILSSAHAFECPAGQLGLAPEGFKYRYIFIYHIW